MSRKQKSYNKGEKIGSLVFIEELERVGRDRFAIFKCMCEADFRVRISHVVYGARTSCGCVGKLARRNKPKSIIKENFSEYIAYKHAIYRCTKPKCPEYGSYGERGIKVCFDSFKEFLDEVGKRPTPKHSIDRIDVNGNYEKGNLRWATMEQQMRNRRNNIYISYGGLNLVLMDWATKLGVKRQILASRLSDGWCKECTVSVEIGGGTCPHRIDLRKTSWARRKKEIRQKCGRLPESGQA